MLTNLTHFYDHPTPIHHSSRRKRILLYSSEILLSFALHGQAIFSAAHVWVNGKITSSVPRQNAIAYIPHYGRSVVILLHAPCFSFSPIFESLRARVCSCIVEFRHEIAPINRFCLFCLNVCDISMYGDLVLVVLFFFSSYERDENAETNQLYGFSLPMCSISVRRQYFHWLNIGSVCFLYSTMLCCL